MIKSAKVFVLSVFLVLPLYLVSGKFALATDPHLFLSPASGNRSAAFNVEVKVDTGGQNIGGVDVYMEFPKNLLKAERVDKGTALPEVYSLIKNDEGKLRINAYFPITRAGESYSGDSGLVATINFSPLGTGTAAVNFICTQRTPPETTDSNIIEKTSVQDIIVCSANVNGSYTLTGGGGTPTPTPTTLPNCQRTCTSDRDCGGSLKCQTVSGSKKCVNPSCSTETDCICNRSCWEICGTDSECPSGLSCLQVGETKRCVKSACKLKQDCDCTATGNTPTPTKTLTKTPTPTMPVTGSTTQTVGIIFLGVLMLLTGSILVFRIERDG